jgi:hypothetical protein
MAEAVASESSMRRGFSASALHAAAAARAAVARAAGWELRGSSFAAAASPERTSEVFAQCGLLRDLAGNPFRSVSVDPSWLSSTVVALAAQMYEARDFSAMPILADALQDAVAITPTF